MAKWSERQILALRQLWGEDHSTAEIGRRLGVSKNAVVGKAHRINLPARPSPVRRRDPNAPPVIKRAEKAPKTTLPPLQSMAAPPVRQAAAVTVQPREAVPQIAWASGPPHIVWPAGAPHIPQAATAAAVAALAEIARPAPAPAPARILRSPGKCEYLKGSGLRSRDWIRCEAEREAGVPYCGEHRALCYTKLRKKDEGDGE